MLINRHNTAKHYIFIFFAMFAFLNASEINNQEVEYSGKTITLPVSAKQINRFVLPASIKSKIASSEKNIEIEINGSEAFVKFSPIMETIHKVNQHDNTSQIEDQKIVYASDGPAEVFFITEKQTYSFILVPSKMDAQTILVNHKQQDKKELEYREKSTPFSGLITDLIRDAFTKKELRGYTAITKNELLASNEQVDVILKTIHQGSSFDIYVSSLENKTDKGVKVEERNFLGIINRPVYGISIFYDNEIYEIPPYGNAQVAIVVAGEN